MNEELEKQKRYYELMLEGTRGKFSVLLYISSLTAALLVIGSSGEGLFPLNNLTRFIISVLLILMVYCVDVYLFQMTKLSSEASRKLLGEDKYPVLNFPDTIKFLLFGHAFWT